MSSHHNLGNLRQLQETTGQGRQVCAKRDANDERSRLRNTRRSSLGSFGPTSRLSRGRTYPAEVGSVILVKPKYVDTKWFGGLDNILVHEMSHIHRRETKYPSENPEIIKDLESRYKTARNYSKKSYQLKTLISSLVNLAEILTDDVAFRVIENTKVPWVEPTRESLQTLVRSKSSWALRTKRKRWKNANLIAMNSICIAEMDRHKIPDTGDKAKTANQKLLTALPEEAQEHTNTSTNWH